MLYLIYDTALDTPYTFWVLKKYYDKNASLFKGTKDEAIMDVSPWLFRVDNGKPDDNFRKEPGVSLGPVLLVESGTEIDVLAIHFKKYIYQTINGQEYFFRFWDKRVLEKFLPSCNKEQIAEFFGPVETFIVTDDTKEEAIVFFTQNGMLSQRKTGVEEIFGK